MDDFIEIKIAPVSKPRMTRADAWKKRKCVLEYCAYKDHLNYLAKLAKFKLGNGFYVKFYLPMPKTWSNAKKQEMAGKWHQAKPDWDNLAKALQDCLLDNDSSVCKAIVEKYWDYEGKILIKNIEV